MLFATEKGFWGFLGTIAGWLHSVGMQMGGPGLALIAFADSSFLSIPQGNDILIIILSTNNTWTTMLYFVFMTVLGSVAGCLLVYWAGRQGSSFFKRRMTGEKVERFRRMYEKWGLWSVMVPAMLPPPTPFKVFVFSAGLFKVPFWRFVFAVAIGRTLRYLLWGSLAVLYGEPVRIFMEEHIQQVGVILIIAMVALLISYAGFRNLAGKRA
jgi:membrane protein YqaA with SNARE-associated domain